MESGTLTRQHETKSVLDLVNLYNQGALELSPAFQRDSVWKDTDRRKLIDTVARNYPLPAIFLYKCAQAGGLHYAVIDGKQRLETLLGFLGHVKGKGFEAKLEISGTDGPQLVSARTLRSNGRHHELRSHFLGYKVPIIEVEGHLSDVMELFVRLNSTGKPLKQQEKRKARYSGSPLLVQATALAMKLEKYWRQTKVMSDQQIARMKHVELAAELMLSAHQGTVINKKAAIDKVMMTRSIPEAQLRKAAAKVFHAVRMVGHVFPQLHTTRFVKVVDYYTLVVLVGRLIDQGAILTDRKRQQLAADLLKAFGIGVDQLREQQRSLKTIRGEASIYRDYLLTVSQMTDDESQRRRREDILTGVLGSVFDRKDEQRMFTEEQRRILWNSSDEKECKCCGETLGWHNFTVDHVNPHSKGGRSVLDNAALMCRSCNSSKGNRRTTTSTVAKSKQPALARSGKRRLKQPG
ncbi:DUF262 domain-containing protein [Frateuria sp. MAH-13]|uniref:DUF262 domain-containing protein n=1 Tax=Frateuria flava TaxID=2821489 RepID=A0ABS4DNC3_9GAMM|nr:DUF262 domain-containing protein [Frateuria flava]MBP1474548.1 DUF262 domain-containing protein [Frateuria flava]